VLRTEELRKARLRFGRLSIRDSLRAAEIETRAVRPEEIPFQFDQWLTEAKSAEKDANWAKAARMYESMIQHYGNELWMKSRAAEAFYRACEFDRAAELVRQVNEHRPTVDTLLLEARLGKRNKDFRPAIELLENARQMLEGRKLVWA
jgi:hypothetical protein